MFGEIARLMALRMSYEDPIRIAQLKLAEFESGAGDRVSIDRRCPEIPARRTDRRASRDCRRPVLDVLEWVGWLHKPVSIRFSDQEPVGHSPPEARGGAAALAAVLGAL